PTEILQQIFERAILPHYLLEHTLAFGRKSFLCLTTFQQKAIMMACRTWYLAGKPYLYQDIVIRRPTQLFQLLVSLKTAPENAGLVTGLHITCFIDSKWAAKFSKTLQSVVHRLPGLRKFTFESSA
ncbi:hypothetical protein BKA70DRAFT_1121214, partial [Coprinopsis sp. MPI-PUGE-AT-0042]